MESPRVIKTVEGRAMPVILALAVCCVVPLVIGAVMVLSGRKKVKSPELADAEYTTDDP